MTVLRPGLLDGVSVRLAGPAGDVVASQLQQLGAQLHAQDCAALVFDAGPAFSEGGDAALMDMLDAAWAAVLDLAPGLIAARRPGKLVLVAPAPHAGPLAGAAADALENLARTLSIEWARHAITTCAIVPGPRTTTEEVAELIAYLLSPAGDYFTGARLALGAVDQEWPGSSAQGTMTASS